MMYTEKEFYNNIVLEDIRLKREVLQRKKANRICRSKTIKKVLKKVVEWVLVGAGIMGGTYWMLCKASECVGVF